MMLSRVERLPADLMYSSRLASPAASRRACSLTKARATWHRAAADSAAWRVQATVASDLVTRYQATQSVHLPSLCGPLTGEAKLLVLSLQLVRRVERWSTLPSRQSLEASLDPRDFEFVEGPGVWQAADHKNSTEWIYQLSADDLVELEAAVLAAQKSEKETKVSIVLTN